MRLRKKYAPTVADLNLAPLIDVIFLLIIFFMLVSRFTRVEVEALSLPPAEQGKLLAEPPEKRLIVNVYPDGGIYSQGKRLSREDFAQLLENSIVSKSGEEISLLIRADRQTDWSKVRNLMEICAASGVVRVKVAVIEDKGEPSGD